MIPRFVTAAILLPILLLCVFYLPSNLFLFLVCLLLWIAVSELSSLLSHLELKTYWFTFPLVLLLPWIWHYYPNQLVIYLIFSSLLCMSWSVFQDHNLKSSFQSASGNFGTLFFLGIPLSIASKLQSHNPMELVLLLSILWAGDSGAYLVGRKFGKHKIFPHLSPKKSSEGYISGLLCSLLTALFLGTYFFPTWSLSYLALIGILLGILGGLGDLFESALKRNAAIKDSSQLIPGHGGLLDRLDSLLFALPAYYILTTFIK